MTLEELQAKASRAKELTTQLEKLADANPEDSTTVLAAKHWNRGDDLLDALLLKKVFAAGRIVVMEEMRKELDCILGNVPESPYHYQANNSEGI